MLVAGLLAERRQPSPALPTYQVMNDPVQKQTTQSVAVCSRCAIPIVLHTDSTLEMP